VRIPVTDGTKWAEGASKWIPIALQTILILGAFLVFAMHSESRLSKLEEGQADLKQDVREIESRINALFDHR
jgi:hypothetical protein